MKTQTYSSTYPIYIEKLQHKGITPDTGQESALRALSSRATALEHPLQRLLRQFHLLPSPKGLYFWGGVGRGKTLLMDLFFENLNIRHKKRLHFHDFMHTIHKELRKYAGKADPLKKIAQQWRCECAVLCLDECTVDDVADALILGELLKHFLKAGIVFITTSNTRPDQLYKNGVQRHLFLKAIDAINKHCDIIEVDNGEDYRHRTLPYEAMYLPESQSKDIKTLFNHLATGRVVWDHTIMVDERPIRVKAMAHRMIWFDFEAICVTARSTPDYLALVKQFDTFFITHVPILFEQDINPTRRFVHLIDVIYDHGCHLVLSAETDPSSLYQGETLKSEFLRTASRLKELETRTRLG